MVKIKEGEKLYPYTIDIVQKSTNFQYIQEYKKKRGNEDFNTMVIQNYDVMQVFVKEAFGEAFLSKSLIDKYGYTNDFILNKISLKL